MLDGALLDLDMRHQLASKIAAEPALEAIMAEFVTRLLDAFGVLTAIDGETVLDLACGSNSSRSPVTGRRTVEFEPWMCRLLVALGARPVGIDIGDLDGEAFEHHRVDLGVPGVLDFLATGSFDAIHESRLFGSPEFRSALRARHRADPPGDPSSGAPPAATRRHPHPQRRPINASGR